MSCSAKAAARRPSPFTGPESLDLVTAPVGRTPMMRLARGCGTAGVDADDQQRSPICRKTAVVLDGGALHLDLRVGVVDRDLVLVAVPRRWDGVGMSLLYQSFIAAFIGAVVLRAVLPRLADVAISYPWAVLALGLGGLIGNGFTYAVQSFTLRHAPPTVAPMLWSSPLLGFAGMAISFFVSYQVIAVATGPRSSRAAKPASASGSTTAAEDWYDAPRGADADAHAGLGDVAARTQNAVAQTCIAVSRSAAGDMAEHVVDALTELGTCVRSLQHATSPDPKVRTEVERLIDGLNRFQTALTQIAADASAQESHVYQRGWLSGSMTDVSDGGSLARYELDHADGLATIRESFERLRALGVLRDDS